jgi:hypothetical protein
MEPKITIKKDYILVEPPEREFWEILDSLAKLFDMPEYLNKNVIWLFPEGPLKTAYDDLYKIKDFVKENLPDNTKPHKKVALVAETGLHAALAQEYAKLAESLALEFKVFPDLGAAEDWILEDASGSKT